METIKKLFFKYKEIILYIIFGVLTTLVNWVVYAVTIPLFNSILGVESWMPALLKGYRVMMELFGIRITYATFSAFLANVIAWIAGVAFAFVTNKIWVFESKSWKPRVALKELWLFVAARLLTGVLDWVGVPLLIAIGLDQPLFGIYGFAAKIIVSVIVVILNYVFSKLFIFKEKKPADKLEANK